ncbi:MAG: translation initiation factor IF-2 [Clostridiales bacterium]|nr:translation initiation factor IF-2 [Clostridiales bacterium]
MAKTNLKDATKDLLQSSESVMETVADVRKGADILMHMLRKLENQYLREEEIRREEEMLAEQERLAQTHTRAYTMPDSEEEAAVAEEEISEETKAEPEAAEAPAVQAEPETAEEADEEPAPEKAVKMPKAKEEAAPPQPAARQAPIAAAAVPQRPYGRPANPQRPYVRPANPQGPYGRPANPQGPYGRPANPQAPYGRPANPHSPYGRPANPQAPYGRPASAQGPYGRSANPQRPYGRPANAQGPYGRPAGTQGGYPAPGRAPAVADIAPAAGKERVSNYDPNKKSYTNRRRDAERTNKNRKHMSRQTIRGGIEDEVIRGGRRARAKKPSAQQMMAPIRIDKALMNAETITVKELTERIGKPAGEILKKLLLLGMMANINSELDFDTASLVCSEFGVELEMKLDRTAEDALTETDIEDAEEDLMPRPPVITIMGHVDHGKTSLLDYIRNTKVTQGEAGGITQHIGAYTVDVDGQAITFLDTPGHEAFTAMRARGTQSTDIAVLVVAADDGVMPQTVESINHAKASEVPIIVAINKMDKENANPERIKQDLTNYQLVPEEWGGETIIVPVSAITGEGVDTLLEMILLQAEVLQLRANPDRMAKGVIIEAKLDKARGPVATVLLQNGTLHVGDNVVVGTSTGRVRAMINDRGERVDEAGPSMPVEIMGFSEVPTAGDDMMAISDDHLGRLVVQERMDKLKAAKSQSATKVTLDNLFTQIDQGKIVNLNIIIKADVQGSVEAVKQALEKLSNDQVNVRVLHSGVGAVSMHDVNLASTFDAIIIGFNIRPDANARAAAEKEGVDIRLYRIIYKAIEDVEMAMKGLLEPEFKEVFLGTAEVRNVFHITGAGTVAGCYVTEGKLQRNAQVRLTRDNVVIFDGKLSSLKRFKDDAREVAQGYECGASLEGYNDIKEGDVIECYILEEIERE